MTPVSPAPSVSNAAIDALFAQSEAARWGVSRAVFAEAVGRAAAKMPQGASGTADVSSLHAKDLALALACADGYGDAWDHFVLTYRPELYRAARAMTDEATGRELADSLYADLFGLSEKDGVRRSLFRYYHGRAKLSTWLRSVLAQRHVDLVRAQRRTTSLDDPEHPADERLPAAPAPPPEHAPRMRAAAAAISEALATLDPPDRLRLAYYYVHDLTLAQTGRLFGEHEATASRKLERARKALRERIEVALRARALAAGDIDDWAAVAREAWDAALAEALAVPAPTAGTAGIATTGPVQGGAPPSFKGKRTP